MSKFPVVVVATRPSTVCPLLGRVSAALPDIRQADRRRQSPSATFLSSRKVRRLTVCPLAVRLLGQRLVESEKEVLRPSKGQPLAGRRIDVLVSSVKRVSRLSLF